MAAPDFWDNKRKLAAEGRRAQVVERQSSNADRLRQLRKLVEDLDTMIEMAEEDDSFVERGSCVAEVESSDEAHLEELKLKALLSGTSRQASGAIR